MRSPRIRVMSALLAMFAAFALVAGACTSDKSDSGDGDDNDSASAEDSGSSDDTDSGDTDSTDTDSAPSGDFNETVSAAIADVNNAADACDLYSAVATLSAVGNPTTQDEVKQAVEFYVAMLNKMSETSSDPDIAATLKTGAADFQAYAESVDYDPEQMDLSGPVPTWRTPRGSTPQWTSTAPRSSSSARIPAGLVPERPTPTRTAGLSTPPPVRVQPTGSASHRSRRRFSTKASRASSDTPVRFSSKVKPCSKR